MRTIKDVRVLFTYGCFFDCFTDKSFIFTRRTWCICKLEPVAPYRCSYLRTLNPPVSASILDAVAIVSARRMEQDTVRKIQS
jgi:hypothetical protein